MKYATLDIEWQKGGPADSVEQALAESVIRRRNRRLSTTWQTSPKEQSKRTLARKAEMNAPDAKVAASPSLGKGGTTQTPSCLRRWAAAWLNGGRLGSSRHLRRT